MFCWGTQKIVFKSPNWKGSTEPQILRWQLFSLKREQKGRRWNKFVAFDMFDAPHLLFICWNFVASNQNSHSLLSWTNFYWIKCDVAEGFGIFFSRWWERNIINKQLSISFGTRNIKKTHEHDTRVKKKQTETAPNQNECIFLNVTFVTLRNLATNKSNDRKKNEPKSLREKTVHTTQRSNFRGSTFRIHMRCWGFFFKYLLLIFVWLKYFCSGERKSDHCMVLHWLCCERLRWNQKFDCSFI